MDEMEQLRALRAELPPARAVARAYARGRLISRVEKQASKQPRPRLRWPRPRLAAGALAGAAAMAAIVAAILVIGSGGSPESAAAMVLRQTAIVAAGSKAPAQAPPGAGQFLYLKTKLVELQGWLPNREDASPKANPRTFKAGISGLPGARAALVPTSREFWISRDAAAHTREILGRVDFLSAADQKLWEGAGSPPPFAFDPTEHHVRRDGTGRAVKEGKSKQAKGVFLNYGVFPDLSDFPTEPEALRLAVEYPRGGGFQPGALPQPGGAPAGTPARPAARNLDAIERLTTILTRPTASSELRAAAFNALAEIPGIELERDVTDVAGRTGDAIVWEIEKGSGFRHEFIFDPRTSQVLADAQVLAGPKAAKESGVPVGTVFRETAYLRAGIVESVGETAAGGA